MADQAFQRQRQRRLSAACGCEPFQRLIVSVRRDAPSIVRSIPDGSPLLARRQLVARNNPLEAAIGMAMLNGGGGFGFIGQLVPSLAERQQFVV